jgi:hypothetical protein
MRFSAGIFVTFRSFRLNFNLIACGTFNFLLLFCYLLYLLYEGLKLHGLSPRANYTDRAIANLCGERVPRGQRDGSLRPYSRFLDRNRYFSLK